MFQFNKLPTLPVLQTEQIGNEVPSAVSGISDRVIGQVVQEVRNYYASGISPFVALCIKHKGNTVVHRAYGSLDVVGKSPVQQANLETPSCIYSASKLVAGMLMLKMVEVGALDLDRPVAYYLPEFGAGHKRRLTTRDMLAHRGGFPNIPKQYRDTELLFDTDKVYGILVKEPLQHMAGVFQAYHAVTTGFVYEKLAHVLLGKSLRDLQHEWVEKPMGLSYLNFGLAAPYRPLAAKQAMAGFHDPIVQGQYLKRLLGVGLKDIVDVSNDPRFMEIVCPSANVYTSSAQMCSYMQMLLNDGTHITAQGEHVQIFKPETVKMTRRTASFSFDLSLLMPMRYGLGSMLGIYPVSVFGLNAPKAFGHLGFTNVLAWADPKRQLAVSFMNTGKALAGQHLPSLMKLQYHISEGFNPKNGS